MTTPDVWIRHDILSREEVVCDKPLLIVDRQMRLDIIHRDPDGNVLPKKSLFQLLLIGLLTIFLVEVLNLIRYDENPDISVVSCEFTLIPLQCSDCSIGCRTPALCKPPNSRVHSK